MQLNDVDAVAESANINFFAVIQHLMCKSVAYRSAYAVGYSAFIGVHINGVGGWVGAYFKIDSCRSIVNGRG